MLTVREGELGEKPERIPSQTGGKVLLAEGDTNPGQTINRGLFFFSEKPLDL